MKSRLSASIIIPHRNRPAQLENCLKSLGQQVSSEEGCEILVVDDNSDTEELQRAREVTGAAGARFVPNRRRPRSAAGARNTGAEEARCPWLLFLDCDCIAPPGLIEHLALLKRADHMVDILPTTASALSTQTLPFVCGTGQTESEILKGITTSPLTQDLRRAFATGPCGEFLCHPAAWVFCWTTGVLVHADLVRQVGGFDESFPGKGSEDMAFGYELFRSGAEFRLPPVTPLLHTPHPRNHAAEEIQDRRHERLMLRTHPRFEMEMLCAFDASNTASAFRALGELRPSGIPLVLSNQEMEILRQGKPIGILGALEEANLRLLSPKFQASVLFRGQETAQKWSLLGLVLPLEDRELDTALIVDLRAQMPESLICRIFQEASRVARKVYYALLESNPTSAPEVSEAVTRQFDRPYWERKFPLSRTYRDWCAAPVFANNHRFLEISPVS